MPKQTPAGAPEGREPRMGSRQCGGKDAEAAMPRTQGACQVKFYLTLEGMR